MLWWKTKIELSYKVSWIRGKVEILKSLILPLLDLFLESQTSLRISPTKTVAGNLRNVIKTET